MVDHYMQNRGKNANQNTFAHIAWGEAVFFFFFFHRYFVFWIPNNPNFKIFKKFKLFIFCVNSSKIIFACNLQNAIIYKKRRYSSHFLISMDFRAMKMLQTLKITRYALQMSCLLQEIAKSPVSEGTSWHLRPMGAM